jgi:hypothetical protein
VRSPGTPHAIDKWSSPGNQTYQSLPRVSPPLGVQAYHQVVAEMPWERKRTLPSIRPTFMPPLCPDAGRLLSHDEVVAGFGDGCTWNIELGPRLLKVLKRGSQLGFHSPCAQRVPDPLHRAYFSELVKPSN